MEADSVKLETRHGVARITLDRPPLNVMDIAMLERLTDGLRSLDEATIKAVLLQARGRAFSAGVDIKDHTPDRVTPMMAAVHDLFAALWTLKSPIVAAVQGPALGGGMELALGCDLVIAAESASFGQPEIKVGVLPPIACLFLPYLVPWPQAMELILTGEPISSTEAHRLGLVTRVVADESLASEVEAWAEQLASLSGPVLKLCKRAARTSLWPDGSWERALAEIERLYLEEGMALADAGEGIQAFMEKRPPRWEDR